MITPRTLLLLPIVPAVLLLGACGSSSTTTATAATSSSTTAVAAGGGGGDFCGVVKENLKVVAGNDVASLLGSGTPADWKAYLAKAEAMNTRMVAAAPASIKPALALLTADSAKLKTMLVAANYDISKMDTAQLSTSMSSPEHVKASATFSAYVKKSCGVDLTTTAMGMSTTAP